MLIQIKNWLTDTVMFSHTQENNSLEITLKLAVKARADLAGANLYGADLTGADLTGAKYGDGIPLEHIPIILQGTKYYIIIMDTHIKIGCELHSHAEWESFSDAQIAEMDSGALEWWNEWKGIVLSLSLGHQQRIAKGE